MSWNPKYIILIILSTLIDYYSAIKMSETEDRKKKKFYLAFSLISNLGLLFSFKYFNFFNSQLKLIFESFNMSIGLSNLDILLPVGISFYTFQTLSYTIDVYKGKMKPERHLGIFALYVSFFPQLVAGPIERSSNLLPQFNKKFDFDYDRVTNGLKLILWGFFKKIVVADRLAILVNNAYNNLEYNSGLILILATIFFGIQIYCDFSGYSDIAIGSAQIMGYKLMTNFKRPYYSKSISEFWKRWHISLSTWFRDYLYIPLGGNRVKQSRVYLNLFLTFMISGLWHGANWTFVFWGALHGFYLIFAVITKDIKERFLKVTGLIKLESLNKVISILTVYILVNFSWIFFRANNMQDAFLVIKKMFINYQSFFNINYINETIRNFGISKLDFTITILSVLILEIFHFIQRKKSIRNMLADKPVWLRWSLYYFIILWIYIFGEYNSSEFIYFQF